jgi:hypothetical protein
MSSPPRQKGKRDQPQERADGLESQDRPAVVQRNVMGERNEVVGEDEKRGG